jgi:hypothetical protein
MAYKPQNTHDSTMAKQIKTPTANHRGLELGGASSAEM